MEASPETEMEIPAPSKRKMSRRSRILAVFIIMFYLILLTSVVLYVYTLPRVPPPETEIHFVKSINSTAYIWTITAILGGEKPLKSDFYVQLKGNGSGTFIIATESLTHASGTHGFNYVPASSGEYLAAGDVFSLSKDYLQGTTIALVTAGATGQYYILTVN
jgi:hypothetical protein